MVPRREEPGIAESLHAVPVPGARSRGVSTARSVLRLLALLAHAEDGMRADEVAEALGKSTSTAYNLLDTLCQEGFTVRSRGGAYHLTSEAAGIVPPERAREVPAGLGGLLDELFERSHKRVYLAAAHSGQVVIPLARGRQGMPRMPGLGTRIGSNAHALALGKVALSLLDAPALDRYIERGLRPYTPHTIVSPGWAARAARRHPRRRGRVRPRGVRRRLLLPRQARRRRPRARRRGPRAVDVLALLRHGARDPRRGADGRRVQGLGGAQHPRGSSDLGRHRRS